MKGTLTVIALFLVTIISFTKAHAETIQVEMVGLKNAKGHVLVQLFASEDDWKNEKSIKNEILTIDGGKSLWRLSELPPGEYAIRCFHDKNDNEKLDSNFLGIPKEPYGFSNNARGRMGPPSWEASMFSFGSESLTIEIELN